MVNVKQYISRSEHEGRIETVCVERGYGIICSEVDKQTYLFYLNTFPDPILQEKVRFLISEEGGRRRAQSIRRCFVNKFGITFVSRVNQHHIHLDLNHYLPLVFDRIESVEEDFISEEFYFDMPIGESICVETDETDDIIYAKRRGRRGATRFVKHRNPETSHYITVILKRIEDYYLLISIYIGRKAGPEPWDEHATKEDVVFWKQHALLYDASVIIKGTETKSCPWFTAE